jgi:hypothetical protein
MAGFGPTPTNWADRYVANMAYASEAYEDIIGAVDQVLPGAYMTQLGGMCLAIEAPIDGGWVWITDEEDNLPWNRARHQGWNIGLYLGHDDEQRDPIRSLQTSDSTLGGLMTALETVLHGVWAKP